MPATEHYGQDYFAWYRRLGEFAAKTNLFVFAPYIRATDRVVDFGCGGGYLLASLNCAEGRGVDVNPAARQEAASRGVNCVACAADIPDGWADVIISNSALEHVEAPLTELRQLFQKVRPSGLVVFSIPHESLGWTYKPGDINQHLYTWSPMCAGNLFRAAGFEVTAVKVDKSLWPPQYERIWDTLGPTGFHRVASIYRAARFLLSPIKPFAVDATLTVVARRPS